MAIDISDDDVVDGGPEGQDHLANIVNPQMLVSTFLLLLSSI